MSPGHLGMGREDAEGRPYASAADVPVGRAGGGNAVGSGTGSGNAVGNGAGSGNAIGAGGAAGTYRDPLMTTGGCADGRVPQTWYISVYIDDGVVYDYEVESMHAAREHASAIVATGYRSVQATSPYTLTHFPPHRITKVKITAPTPIQTNYHDRVRGA